MLPRCSYGFRNEGPRWNHGSSRFYPGFIPVTPCSTTVRPGVAPVVHGAVPVTAGRVTVCAGGVTVLPRFATVRPGLPGRTGELNRDSENRALYFYIKVGYKGVYISRTDDILIVCEHGNVFEDLPQGRSG